MAEIDRQALATDALGSVLVRTEAHGDCAVVLDPHSVVDAQLAWPGATVFTPHELAQLNALIGNDTAIATVVHAKRELEGFVNAVRLRDPADKTEVAP